LRNQPGWHTIRQSFPPERKLPANQQNKTHAWCGGHSPKAPDVTLTHGIDGGLAGRRTLVIFAATTKIPASQASNGPKFKRPLL
jgi:hypothetical protein